MAFSNILPDPNNPINDAGKADSTASAPGFASLQITSESKTLSNRTNSGRLIISSSAGHTWGFSVQYNPLTREAFEPVYNFLLQQKGRLTPFFMSLPQHILPRDTTFASTVSPSPGLNKTLKMYTGDIFATQLIKGFEYKITSQGSSASNWNNVGGSPGTNGTVFTATGSSTGVTGGRAALAYVDVGYDNITMSFSGYNVASQGAPKPGDFFTVTDPLDTLHTKLYKVTRVETPTLFEDTITAPSSFTNPTYNVSSQGVRIYFTPKLQRKLHVDASINFYDPKARVIIKNDLQEYSLSNENLYSFSLGLEEAQK